MNLQHARQLTDPAFLQMNRNKKSIYLASRTSPLIAIIFVAPELHLILISVPLFCFFPPLAIVFLAFVNVTLTGSGT